MQLKNVLILALVSIAAAAPTDRWGDGGNRPQKGGTTCSQNQSTMCCNHSGKKCKVDAACNNNQAQICGISLNLGMVKRWANNGEEEDKGGSVSCSQSQSSYCCNHSGKNCEVKDSCSNNQIMFCPDIDIDLGDVLGGGD